MAEGKVEAPCCYCDRDLIGAARWAIDEDGRLVCLPCVKRRGLEPRVSILTKPLQSTEEPE